MLRHLIIQFLLNYLSSGDLQVVKNKRKFKLLALKVVAVTCKRWLLTRGFKYSDSTWKLLVFWKTGRWGEAVAYKRCSLLEFQLYYYDTEPSCLITCRSIRTVCRKYRKCSFLTVLITSLTRVRNCDQLVANVTENWVLAIRILTLVT